MNPNENKKSLEKNYKDNITMISYILFVAVVFLMTYNVLYKIRISKLEETVAQQKTIIKEASIIIQRQQNIIYRQKEIIDYFEKKQIGVMDITPTKTQLKFEQELNKKKEEYERKKTIEKIKMMILSLSEHEIDDCYLEMISSAFYGASKKFDIDYRDLVAMAWHESRFIHTRISKVGATGIMQVMPFWTRNRNFRLKTGIEFEEDLKNPVMNIYAGAFVYRFYYDYWVDHGISNEKQLRKFAILSYNRGGGRVKQILRSGGNPENGYYKVVSWKINKLKQKGF